LEITLETGRTHQIRVQAASRGFAVLGDAQYGCAIAFGPQSDDPRERAIALCARRLGFSHPVTREQVAVAAPLPATWLELGVADE
jgi:23S rRNA pseudouridine1911/1915/1917 synthase